MNTITAGIQGSGWGWLGFNPATLKLEIVTTANQDPLLCELRLVFLQISSLFANIYFTAHTPIIGIDIWEHAFYLQYKNVKADYLKAIWKVVNFEEAEKRFVEAQKEAKLGA